MAAKRLHSGSTRLPVSGAETLPPGPLCHRPTPPAGSFSLSYPRGAWRVDGRGRSASPWLLWSPGEQVCRDTAPPAYQDVTGRPYGTGSDPTVDRCFSLRSSAPCLWQILFTLTSGISLVQVTSQGKVPGGWNLERGGPSEGVRYQPTVASS